MRRFLLAFIVVLLAAGAAQAQAVSLDRLTPPLPTAGERRAADMVSWATALAAVALDTRAAWTGPARGRALALEGARLGIVYGAAFAAKRLIGRHRPCAPDCGADNADFSFFSAHTAVAFSTLNGSRFTFVLPLAITTGGLRIAAGKHWLTDVLAGAGVGWLASRVR